MLKNIRIANSTYAVSSDDNYLDAMGDEFEPHMVELFRILVGPNDVVADIGANIGLTALLFSGMAKQTYAFEPSPSTHSLLAENLARNRVSNVKSFNCGLGQKQERLTITFAANNRSGGYVSDKIRPEEGHITEQITIDTLDDFFVDRQPTPTFLKIDVEGFEMNVISGAETFLATNKPIVVMEMNHFCLDVLQRVTLPDFLDFMRGVFPYLYAVDHDNRTVANLHHPESAYSVMHDHVVKQRFPNIVGGFDLSLASRLSRLQASSNLSEKSNQRPPIREPKGAIEAIDVLQQIGRGAVTTIHVRISNAGDETWYHDGDHPVFLCYHWINPDGDMHVYDGVRSKIVDARITPGMTIEQSMIIFPPQLPGTYRLVLTLVQEGVCWFEECGFGQAELDVEVV
ncbi:FkbM family methyltransferase [Pseudoxanthomonas winnipegensis]|uniref:FkbM family methyltransferase n=1 Tax=Pseudoxanthomonas winnipegensis TaxID=2480810 RepID=A0A4Q8LPD1_9GAMM|nr:FkbM family methyltransferase [Pseudoxanthomonas winnipegensis]RZZ89460.1 FkbM family methyltransferase [Pseudoxanthomonas winnipegensis]TAA33098.1 FkbM family methyltransferase [Pseudoxanthomonas winnipegensis]TBV78418.1 FkbM family methyltransferase [Pseudoxanthomonas winnipegensis]